MDGCFTSIKFPSLPFFLGGEGGRATWLWDLNSQPGIEPAPSAVKAQSPNHWTAREFPIKFPSFLSKQPYFQYENTKPLKVNLITFKSKLFELILDVLQKLTKIISSILST